MEAFCPHNKQANTAAALRFAAAWFIEYWPYGHDFVRLGGTCPAPQKRTKNLSFDFNFVLAATAAAVVILASAVGLKRLAKPEFTLPLAKRRGAALARVLNRIKPDLDLKMLVKVTNRHFRRPFADTAFAQRMLFLPICLKPLDCQAQTTPEKGLLCDGQCPGCELGRLRNEALALGYSRVYVVPSSRLRPKENLLPSDEFIHSKMKSHAPAAALGVTCAWYLRNRLLAKYELDNKGYSPDGNGAVKMVFQGVLLNARNCRRAQVDWQKLRQLMNLTNHHPPREKSQGDLRPS